MPCFTVPIHEHNDCHTPAGSPQGGQFCSKGTDARGFTAGIPDVARDSVEKLRDTLTSVSFRSGVTPHETMGVIDLTTGEVVGDLLTGDEDSVEIPKALQRKWALHYPGPLLTAHTHPKSAPFSFDDFELHNSINQQAGYPAVEKIQVYGDDGSWYELTFPKVFANDEVVQIHKTFRRELEYAGEAAGLKTDRWAKQQPWWENRPPKTWDLMTEREHIRHAAEKAGQFDVLEARHREHFKAATDGIWEVIAKRFKLPYRRYQTPDPDAPRR